MQTLRARWVLPVTAPPIENGWIEIADGRIAACGSGTPPHTAADLGDVAILPGLVNAHTHLELSWMAGGVPPARSMPAWIRAMLAVRRDSPDELTARVAADAAVRGAMATGTVLFGDISNSLASVSSLVSHAADAVVFHELIGFRVEEAEPMVSGAWQRVQDRWKGTEVAFASSTSVPIAHSVVAHAPYSVSPALFREVARQRREAPLSVHLGESAEEIEFLQNGAGPFRELLDDLGVWTDSWTPPRCGPVEYLRRVGYLQPGLLAVHAGHLTNDELTMLASAGAMVVACPRSNVWVGAGAPDVTRFYRAGVPVAVGTDSLASVDTLNLFDELAALRRAAPGIAPARLLESATLIGARALGRERDFGSIISGKRAALVAVDVPADTRDVEEYLVSGVPADRVRRVEIA